MKLMMGNLQLDLLFISHLCCSLCQSHHSPLCPSLLLFLNWPSTLLLQDLCSPSSGPEQDPFKPPMAASCSGLRRQLLSNPGRSLPAFVTFCTPFFNSENQLQLSTLKQCSPCFMVVFFCFHSKPYEAEAVSLRVALATTQGQTFTERIQKRGGWGRLGFQFQGEKLELILLAYRHGDVWENGRVDPSKKKKRRPYYPECYSQPLQPPYGLW